MKNQKLFDIIIPPGQSNRHRKKTKIILEWGKQSGIKRYSSTHPEHFMYGKMVMEWQRSGYIVPGRRCMLLEKRK